MNRKKYIHLSYKPSLVSSFRRRALASRKEILAWLVGEWVIKEGLTYATIEELAYPELRVSTPVYCEPTGNKPRGCIGSIHSHPNCPWRGQSHLDHEAAILNGDKLWGICSGGKYKSSIEWYAHGKIVVVK